MTANQFGVSGIPDVRIFIDGKEVDRFVGALPEPKIREILSKHMKSEIDRYLEEAYMEYMAGNLEEAEKIYEKLMREHPENKKIILEAAKFYIKENKLDEAERLLSEIKEYEKEYFPKAQALKELITLRTGVRISQLKMS